MNGVEIRDRLLHHPRTLDDLRQKHLARPEQIAHHVHAVHERPFDDRKRSIICLPRLLDVRVDVVERARDQRRA